MSYFSSSQIFISNETYTFFMLVDGLGPFVNFNMSHNESQHHKNMIDILPV